MTFELLIPGSLWLALALIGSALLAWYALRRPSVVRPARWWTIIAMMGAGFALVLAILLNPTWVREIEPPPGKPLLTILLDASASMATPDATGGVTRYAAGAEFAKRVSERLNRKFDVRVFHFAGATSATDLEDLGAAEPTGDSTNVSSALLASLDEQRPQGQAVVLLSDGIDNAPGGAANVLSAVRLARAGATPIYTHLYGGHVGGQDLAIELRSSQDLAIVNQKVPVTAHLIASGLGAVKANVLLLQDGKEIARRETMVTSASPSDVHFAVSQEKTGVYPYEVRVDPLPGERTQANNTASYLLRIVDEPICVLVLEGKPYWDSKFFMRTLASDPAVALDSVVRMTDTRYMRRTLGGGKKSANPDDKERLETWKIVSDAASILEDAQGLKAYQVVVLGRDSAAFLTVAAVASLSNWISRDGGSLVCYRGAPEAQVDQKLGRVLPVRWAPSRETHFRVKLTDQGRDMQWLGGGEGTLAAMPALASATRVEQPKPLAVVLATASDTSGQEAPAAVYQPYGSGRVVVIEGAGMWRWAFLPPQYRDHEQVYAALWPSLLRWLTSGTGLQPGQQMTLRADKIRFATAEAATATLLARKEVAKGELPNVELVSADAKTNEVKSFAPAAMGEEPGVFRVNFGKLPPGRYQIRIANVAAEDASARAAFDVRTFGQEQLDLESRPDLMARIAADSEGMVLTSNDSADEIAARFREHFVKTHPARIERVPAWDRWWVIAAVVTLWAACWGLRRSGGLI